MNYTVGKQYHYHEMGCEWIVTLLSQSKDKDDRGMNNFELQVDEVLEMGAGFNKEAIPRIGHKFTVAYRDGYQHYSGWSLRDK